MTEDICGSTDTADGTPCQNPAGHGTESDIGPCHLHPTRGRPSKYTEERREAILEAARHGTTIEGCARAGGIHHSTLYDWMDQYDEFSEAFNRARAAGEQRLIPEADPEFILERSYGYTKTQEIEHSGEGGIVVYTQAEDVDG